MAITEGLPAAGSNIGGFFGGIAPGAGAMILTVGVAKGVVGVTDSIAKRVAKEGKSKKKKSNKKTIHKPRKKLLTKRRSLIPTYKHPKMKMGPY